MTVHNGAPYLRTAIESIVNQSFKDWELVVIDDGSTDESRGILESFADPRIRVFISPANKGRTPALREAFELARADYCAVLDADDIADPERLAKQVSYLDDHPTVLVVGTWSHMIDAEGNTLPDREWTPPTDWSELRKRLAWSNPFVHSSVMYRSRSARDVGGYPSELAHAQDCGLWLKLAVRGEVAIIDEYLCSYRLVPSGLTQSKANQRIVAHDRLHLLRVARMNLDPQNDALRLNRDETLIAGVKLGLALLQGRAIIRGSFVLLLSAIQNLKSLIRNRVVQAHIARLGSKKVN